MSTEKEPFNEPETLIDRLLGRYAMGPGNPPEFGYRQIGEPAPIHKEAVREIETLRERVKELKALVRQLAIKFKYSEPPHGLISAAADMYPYIKGEILQKADRVLDGVLEL